MSVTLNAMLTTEVGPILLATSTKLPVWATCAKIFIYESLSIILIYRIIIFILYLLYNLLKKYIVVVLILIQEIKATDMQVKRYRDDRGPTDAGWLKSMHTFSFGHYHDPEHMGFASLRVINDDRVIPDAGFGTHPHSNMEIISYVLSGELAHKDSMGNGSIIKPGDVQLMSAGTGITHSEYNGSDTEQVHFLQIWIMPNVENTVPEYQQESFKPDEMHNRFRIIVSEDGAEGSLVIKQDARLFVGKFDEDMESEFITAKNRKYWLQIAKGKATVNDDEASAGDGFAIQGEDKIIIKTKTASEILLFDLAQ
ncbi:Pirin [hydrothermal vent metagenome]|uniref:Pirin n=1 Tax=hydrothermal vent metagenome TaxID=652676 RepID=A0A3B0RI36_9ZZZZ